MSPAHHGRYVAYYRVSTGSAGQDRARHRCSEGKGEGISRRRAMAAGAMTRGDRRAAGSAATGQNCASALDYCKRNKGTKLVVATLSRLTRDTKFLLTLIDGSVDVVFTDLPQVPPGAMGRFFLTMMAAVAEFEAGLTSERTKAALAQVKARGEKRLGNPKNLAEAQRKGAAKMKEAADAFAARLIPTIRDIQRHGAPSLHSIADTLNTRGIPTVRGKTWTAMQVSNVLARADR